MPRPRSGKPLKRPAVRRKYAGGVLELITDRVFSFFRIIRRREDLQTADHWCCLLPAPGSGHAFFHRPASSRLPPCGVVLPRNGRPAYGHPPHAGYRSRVFCLWDRPWLHLDTVPGTKRWNCRKADSRRGSACRAEQEKDRPACGT